MRSARGILDPEIPLHSHPVGRAAILPSRSNEPRSVPAFPGTVAPAQKANKQLIPI